MRAAAPRGEARERPYVSSVLPFLGLPFGHAHGLPRDLRPAVCPRSERVLEEVLVVALGIIVRARVRTATLFAREPRLDHARGQLEQEPELERLREVVVEDPPFVLDDDALVALR